MSSRRKRRIDDEIDAEEANASDPEDSDFELHTPRKRTRSSRPTGTSASARKNQKSTGARRQGRNNGTSQQRRKRSRQQRYRGEGDSEDDDDEDEDDESDLDEGGSSDSEVGGGFFGRDSSEGEESVELNPLTGRAMRKAATKKVNYILSDDDDDEAEEGEGQDIRQAREGRARNKLALSSSKKDKARVKKEDASDGSNSIDDEIEEVPEEPQKSFLVKLKVSHLDERLAKKNRQSSRQPEMHHTRRQSRFSGEEPEFLSLTNSGNHVIRRASTHSPEIDPLPRPTRASKGLKKPVSAIMEASQEDSQGMKEVKAENAASDDGGDGVGKVDEKAKAGKAAEDDEDDDAAQVQSSDNNRVQSQEEIRMEDAPDEDEGNAGVGVIQESVHGDEDEDGDGEEDNEDDVPVLRHGRTTRVSKHV